MRPTLAALVRTILLAESDDPAERPPDRAEGGAEEVTGSTDTFHSVYPEERAYLDKRFSDVLRLVSGEERSQIVRDRDELGAGWIDRYMDRLSRRPLTEEEMAGLFSHHAAWTSVPDIVRSIYSKSVSWCLLTEKFVGLVDETLKKIGARRVVEVGAGRGVLAGFMRQRGYDWQAYDATSVQSSGVRRASAARVLSSLRPGSCDVIAVSWAHFEDDWDVGLLDASERLGVPILSIAVPPDVPGGVKENSAGVSPSFTHSGPFWSRVDKECAVSYEGGSESRRDGVFVITPRSVDHPLSETPHHTSDKTDVLHAMSSIIFTTYEYSEGGSEAIAALPYTVRWKLGIDEQGTDYEDVEIKLAEEVIKRAESLAMLQRRQEIREKAIVRMPSVREWLPRLVQEICSFIESRRATPIVRLLDNPVDGSWFSVEEDKYV